MMTEILGDIAVVAAIGWFAWAFTKTAKDYQEHFKKTNHER